MGPTDSQPPDPTGFWNDPEWSWIIWILSLAVLINGGPELLGMNEMWARLLFFAIVVLSAGSAVYFGFIAKRMRIGGKYGSDAVRGIWAKVAAAAWLLSLAAAVLWVTTGKG